MADFLVKDCRMYEVALPHSIPSIMQKLEHTLFERPTETETFEVDLVNSSGDSIRCVAWLSIKRLAFDLPCLVCGSFLPIFGKEI